MRVKCVHNYDTGRYNGTGSLDELIVGRVYTVTHTKINVWNTLYTLEGVSGTFNSVLFEELT